MMRWLVVMGAVVTASCVAADDEPSDGATSSTQSSTTEGSSITVEGCDELLSQAECEAAVVGDGVGPDACLWFDVRVPGAACSSDAVVPQCVGMSYVGEGCQAFACPGDVGVDGFFRMVDGQVQVFANPGMNCGLVATSDGWNACIGTDIPVDCSCLCQG